MIAIPEKRLCLEHEHDPAQAAALRIVWKSTQDHLLSWAQRQHRPLLINSAGRSNKIFPPCKILSVPIMRDNGRVLGILVFYNPEGAADFQDRQQYGKS